MKNTLPDYKVRRAEKTVAAFRKGLLKSLARSDNGVTVFRVSKHNGGVRAMTEHEETKREAIEL